MDHMTCFGEILSTDFIHFWLNAVVRITDCVIFGDILSKINRLLPKMEIICLFITILLFFQQSVAIFGENLFSVFEKNRLLPNITEFC